MINFKKEQSLSFKKNSSPGKLLFLNFRNSDLKVKLEHIFVNLKFHLIQIVNKNRSEVKINSNLLKILKTLVVRFSALVKACLNSINYNINLLKLFINF
ncbi:hypothetical protein KUTeg_007164 [Tegillarca granosa]|uniref:Uncharacterized protein n=1 Tax=Tegillarca granosa TaxID=220873 RepID=A0ABQ9FCG3_TEGGR|nr:hypothetical protein KUTeg_007164 [Tegillarca granosa]